MATAHAHYTKKPRRPPTSASGGMLNTGWIEACKRAGPAGLHVHDLRHTAGMRLREAGIPEHSMADILWHSHGSIARHDSIARVEGLWEALESIRQEAKELRIPAECRIG